MRQRALGGWSRGPRRALGVTAVAWLLAASVAVAEPAPPSSGESELAIELPTQPVEPLGPPAPPPADSQAPRNWLAAPTVRSAEVPLHSSSSLGGLSLTLATLLVLALGGSALLLRLKRRQALGPELGKQGELVLLSSSRLGSKAQAVSLAAGGRVMLLGVTEQSVTHLAWLDGDDAEPPLRQSAPVEASEPSAEADEDDELPDDYPGSALRAPASEAPLVNATDLARFQKLLAAQAQPAPRPSAPPSSPFNAASHLADRTSDVVSASATDRLAPVLSMRRKRRRRRSEPAALTPRARPPQPAEAEESSVEGQVAGLRAMRSRG